MCVLYVKICQKLIFIPTTAYYVICIAFIVHIFAYSLDLLYMQLKLLYITEEM